MNAKPPSPTDIDVGTQRLTIIYERVLLIFITIIAAVAGLTGTFSVSLGATLGVMVLAITSNTLAALVDRTLTRK